MAELAPSLRRQMLKDLIAFEVENGDEGVPAEIEAMVAAARATVKWQGPATSTNDEPGRVTTDRIRRTTSWGHSGGFPSSIISASPGSTREE